MAALALVAGTVGAGWWWRPRRIEVAGSSMTPALQPGDRLLVVRARRVAVGDVVALIDPRVPGRLLVKRVGALGRSEVTVVGDNPPGSTDSRHFGPVPFSALRGRAWYRYHPQERAGRLRRPVQGSSQSRR